MGKGRRTAGVVVGTGLIALLISIGLTLARVDAPSSGTVIAPVFASDGLPVTTIPGVTTPLRDGDVVVAIDGRPIAAWIDRSAGPGPALAIGEVVQFDVRRDGQPVALDVPLVALPFPSILLGAWGTLTFVFAMFVLGVIVFGLRPSVPAAGALFLAGVGGAGSTVPYLLGQDPLDAVTGQLAPILLGTAAVYLLLWAGLIDFTLVFPRPVAAIVRRPALRLVPYLAMFVGFAAALAVALATSPDLLAWIGTWGPLTLLPTIAAFIATPVFIAFRWRRAERDERRLLRGFGAVMGFIIVSDLIVWVVPEALGGPPLLPWTIAAITGLPFPIVVAMSILRDRLFDIDVVVRRSSSTAA